VIELKWDIDRDAHENIFKQLRSLNDQQKRYNQSAAIFCWEEWEKVGWFFFELVQALEVDRQRVDNFIVE